MQQLSGRTEAAANSKIKKIQLLIPALVWVAGLLLAGSDGPWMPYANCAGGLAFLAATIWLGRLLPGLDPKAQEERETNKVKASKVKASLCRSGACIVKGRFARDLGVV
ncbi:MAG: hypothetical protein HUN04_00990 [Desulfobacter sp.]|nr:MAG: hypothetical protein HUN04_00990 [Desulfobacter sp.]